MPEYLAPGVFVEEIDSGSKPIEGVGTSTAAFVGYAKSGDFNKPIFITNWTQFVDIFGQEENLLLQALADELGSSAGQVLAAKTASRKGWMEYAQQAIDFKIREPYSEEDATKKRTEIEKKVRSTWSKFLSDHPELQRASPYMDGSYLAHAVKGFYTNGGTRAYIVRVPLPADLEAHAYTGNGSGKAAGNGQHIPAARAQADLGGITIKALKAGPEANDATVEVTHVGDDGFTMKVSQGDQTEDFGTKDKPLTPKTVADAVNKGSNKSRIIEVETATATATRPAARVFNLEGGIAESAAMPVKVNSGVPALAARPHLSEVEELAPVTVVGSEDQRSGIAGLIPIDDVNIICAPDLMAGLFTRQKLPGTRNAGEELTLSDERRQAILDAQCSMVAYCERNADRVALLDPLPGLNPQGMRKTTMDTPYNCQSGHAAIYYPWIKVADPDPARKGQQIFVPPCGHIAGVWARTDMNRGVHKAPANEPLLGVVSLEYDTSKPEQEILNPDGINCIRQFPGTGIRVWGARTLATNSNPSWKYLNVRRLFDYLEKSMDKALQWVVFEPNDHDLWGRVRRTISAFLYTEWKEGKLFGTTPNEAYYVKCDEETNPQEMIDLGRLYVEIGVNPVKPAEFVIIRIGQWASGSNVAEA